MKKLLLATIFFVAAYGSVYSQNVLNPGFESWTAGDPDYWMTDNGGGLFPVTESSDAHSGSKSARCEVINFSTIPYTPVLNSDSTYGFPISQAYTTLEFWYKLYSPANDAISVTAIVYDGSNSTIAYAVDLVGEQTSVYTHKTIPFFTRDQILHCLIYLTITDTTTGSTGNHIGTYFLVDDVQLTNSIIGVGENSKSLNALSVFPNPASKEVTVRYTLDNPSTVNIGLYDLAGKKVLSKSLSGVQPGMHSEEFDVRDLRAGKYICRLQYDSGNTSSLIEIVK